jgi:A/G-specific adenine glycosylase
MPVIAQTVDDENPREWYYALMDYGVMLKKKYPNPSRKSKHHALQSKFDGSDRQIRGALIRLLLDQPYTRAQLPSLYAADQERILRIVDKMISENIIRENNAQLTIE